MPMVGSNWSHDGVSELYNNIDGNGYHMIYISSRGIGQIDRTKSYLESLSLPKGPVLLAPHGLLESYSRIKSHKNVEFKIAVLNALRDLFPASNPFACGFGNTQEDQRAYAQVGIPLSKIFIMDSNGYLTNGTSYRKTYMEMNELVKNMFPSQRTSYDNEDAEDAFNAVNFWKIPPGKV